MGPNFRYWGFLSYSHDDRQAAERLHRALEAYRIPPRLAGLDGPFGPVPARLLPIFRDRDELNAGAQLGPAVETALARSRSLIVLCSPRAATSQWVDAELAAFEALHPDGPLFCVIVAGEPLAPADATGEAAECLPPTARKRFSSKPGIEESAPIAVDLRPEGDGWRLAIHKIVAGLTGLPLDQLVQRDAQRRHKRLAWFTAALAGTAIALGTMAVMAYRARDEARIQRAQAEGLVEFMLVDLRKRLEPAGRLDALDAVGERALHYYGQQSPRSLDLDALGRRARALHLIGEVSDRRGDVQAARKAFATARNSTAELLARAPGHPQRLYDHAQSVYWNGYIDWQYGDVKNAEKAFEEYARLARQLSSLDPANPEWLAEVGYAHSNLGVLLLEQLQAARAIPQFQESLRINRRRAALPGDQALVQLDIGQDRAWLSTAYFANRRLREAIAERLAEIEIYGRLLGKSPDDAQVKDRNMWAHTALAELYLSAADFPQARRQLQLSTALADELRNLDSDNVSWKQSMAKSKLLASELHRRMGMPEEALANLDAARALIDAQLAQDPETAVWRIELQEAAAMEQVALLLQNHDTEQAEVALQASQQRLQEASLDALSAGRGLRFKLLNLAAQADLAKVRDDPRGRQQALRSLALLGENNVERLDGVSAALLASAWRELGRGREAESLAGQLEDLGYRQEGLRPDNERSIQSTSFDPGESQ